MTKKRLGYKYLLVLALLLLPFFSFLLPTKTAKAAIDTWVDANGNDVNVALTDWSERLEFRSPIQIRDKVTGRVYNASSAIFDSGSQSYLRNGSGNYSDSNYIYALQTADLSQPVYVVNGKCVGVISWHLHGDGSESDLHLIQPDPVTGVASDCSILEEDGEAPRTTVRPGVRTKLAESVNTNLVNLGDNPPENWSGGQPHVRMSIASLYWKHQNELGTFDSDVYWVRITSTTAYDEIVALWTGDNIGGFVPDRSTRQEDGWSYWIASKPDDPECRRVFVVTRDGSPGNMYPIDYGDSRAVNIDDNTFAGCAWNREMEGDSNGLIDARDPEPLAYPENATLTAEEVNPAMFGETTAPADSNNGGTETETEVEKTCSTEAGVLGWILCGVLAVLDETTQFLEEQIRGLLFINPDQFDRSSPNGASLYRSWSIFRSIATVIIVVIALIMIFSEAMGAGIFDNYSVKKLLPRLVIAGIAIQLSWFLMAELVNVFNALGNGIGGLLMSPFQISPQTNLRDIINDAVPSIASTDGLLFTAMIVAGTIAFIGALVAIAIAAVAALFIGFITLVIRNMIVLLGVVLSPVAIAMSVLPGTQKTSKWWWESLEKALLMYPMVIALLAAGKIIGKILLDSGDAEESPFILIAAILAWYAPYFLIPKALQAGGAALGKLTGIAGDKSKGFFDKAKNWDQNRKKWRQGVKEQSRFERAGGTGLGAAVARAQIRSKNGQNVTGLSARGARRDAMNRSMKSLQDKAFEDAVKEADLVLQDSGNYSNDTELVRIAQTSNNAAERMAAINRLATLKRDGAMRTLMNNPGNAGREINMAANRGTLAGAFSDKAPDLARGARADAAGAFGSPGGAFGASAEKAAGWSSGTWNAAFDQHPTGAASTAQTVYDDKKKWDSLSPEVQQVLRNRGNINEHGWNNNQGGGGNAGGGQQQANPGQGNPRGGGGNTGSPHGGGTPNPSATPVGTPRQPTPRERVESASHEDMDNWVQSVGGWQNMSQADLVRTVNSRNAQDTHGAAARAEVDRRRQDGTWQSSQQRRNGP